MKRHIIVSALLVVAALTAAPWRGAADVKPYDAAAVAKAQAAGESKVKVFRVGFDKERAALRSTGAVEEAELRKIFEAAL